MAKVTKKLISNPLDSEVEAYGFIRDQLRELGWSLRDPSRHLGGQVWTQQQCLADPEIKKCLGLARPENIVKLSDSKLWIIEAKSKRSMLKVAIQEAKDDYAAPIEKGGFYSVPLISGVAGNDATGYEIRTFFKVNGTYEPVTITNIEATGLLDQSTVQTLLDSKKANIAEFVVNETLFLRTAESINRTLHTGGINKNDRALVMAALLLSLLEGTPVNVDGDLPLLIDDINNRTANVLRKHGKKEFFPFVRIEPPTSDENHVKYKAALVRTIQALNNLSIKSAMNSGTDVLGKFYEVFLRYGNGAKEIGIVLTPRHITRFAVDTVGVSPSDLVLDPACGTGGFLVAAFDHVRSSAKPAQVERFKKHSLFGIEQESKIAALAIVNMIFRGDGKNNITEANCFTKHLQRSTVDGVATAIYTKAVPKTEDAPITKVFMNPPFALKKSDEREWSFVEAAMKSVADGGTMFVIVPMSVVSEGGSEGDWRKHFLKHHTLLSVVSLPEELFYPVSVQTVAIILKKGIPHPPGQAVFWGRVVNDGFKKSKGKRLALPPGTPNDLEKITEILKPFLNAPTLKIKSRPEFYRKAAIDFNDPILEFAPEAYLDSRIPSPQELATRLDRQVRENIAALVDLDLRFSFSGRPSILDSANKHKKHTNSVELGTRNFDAFPLEKILDLKAGDYHSLAEEDPGLTPVVSCADTGNGVAGTYAVAPDTLYRDALTIAFNGSPLTTKLHPYGFAAKDDVAVALPKEKITAEALIFVQAQLNAERWRFSYYRKCFRAKLGRTTIELPVTSDGSIDWDYMTSFVQAQPYWWFLAPRLKNWQPTAKPTISKAEE